MKKIETLCLVLIVFLAFLLRFYRFTINPPHLYWDEASIAYNAYSVNQTGEDEWGDHNPFLFRSFGDYKLPLYIYVTALSERVFGLSEVAVRFPSALAGTLTVLVVFFLVREQLFLVRQKFPRLPYINFDAAICLSAALFLAISPWHLQFSRAGFEANLALFFRALGALLFLLSMRQEKYKLLFPALFCFAAAAYTYHSAAVTSPLILGMLILLFFRQIWSNLKKVLPAFIFLVLIILPYLPGYVFSAYGRTRFTGESVTNMPGNVVTNVINNYVANFSLDFLFFHGDQDGRHSVKKLGELYLWQLPAMLAGIYFLFRYRSKTTVITVTWLLVAAIPPAATVVSPHALRDLLAVRSWQTVSAIGFIFLLFKIRPALRFLVIPIIAYALLLYLHIYYVHYPIAYAADWQDGEKETVVFVKKIADQYDHIFVYKTFDSIYLLLYWPVAPQELHANGHNLTRFAKFSYFDFSTFPASKDCPNKCLIIGPAWLQYDESKLLRQFSLPSGQPVYRVYEF